MPSWENMKEWVCGPVRPDEHNRVGACHEGVVRMSSRENMKESGGVVTGEHERVGVVTAEHERVGGMVLRISYGCVST